VKAEGLRTIDFPMTHGVNEGLDPHAQEK